MGKNKSKGPEQAVPKQEDHLAYFGESHAQALLLDTIVAACSLGNSRTISSNDVRAYARAIQELDMYGLVTILTEEDNSATARITAKGEAYLEQLLKDDEEERAEQDRQSPAV